MDENNVVVTEQAETEQTNPATPEPAKDEKPNADIEKLKAALSKANSEAAEWKRQFRAKQSEAERAEAERAEGEQKMRDELETLRKEKRVSDYTGKCLALNMDIPDMTKFNAAEYSVAHNNGNNCKFLATPGVHTQEFRTVRQKYTVSKTNIDMESVKFRLTGLHKSTEKGTIETGNPWGSTDKYSLVRYEEIVDGVTTMLIDGPANIVRINGKDYAGSVQALLN